MYGNILQMWGMTDLVEFSDNPLHYLIEQLHPYFAQPIEQAINVDTFLNRPIVRPELEAVRKDMIRTGEIEPGSWDWFSTTFLGSMQPEGVFNVPARAEHFLRMFSSLLFSVTIHGPGYDNTGCAHQDTYWVHHLPCK